MTVTEIVVGGTLKPDGTLELDEKLALPPGRVTVTLRKSPQPAAGDSWWQAMLDARKAMAASGCPVMDDREMQAHIDWLREEDQVDELLRDGSDPAREPEPR
jgi:hypothetical protein